MIHRFLRRTAIKMLRASFNADNNDMERNGEVWLMRKIAPAVKNMIDVGYNHGMYTRHFLSIAPDLKVLGIEAMPEFFKESLASLPLGVTLLNIAAGKTEETLTIYKKGDGANASSIPAKGKDFQRHDLICMPGDKIVSEQGFGPAQHLKVDTDGYDMAVLLGFEASIDAWRPSVQFEFGRFWIETNYNLRDAYSFFADKDYKIGFLKPDSIEFFKYSPKLEIYAFNINLVAVPSERIAEFIL